MNSTAAFPSVLSRFSSGPQLLRITWLHNRIRPGLESRFEILTFLVHTGARIKVACISGQGIVVSSAEGFIVFNRFLGKITVPASVSAGARLYLEAYLPEYRLKRTSAGIPATGPLEMESIGWSKKGVLRGETVRILCRFKNGVVENEPARVVIHEHDSSGRHEPVTALTASISRSRLELVWKNIFPQVAPDIPARSPLFKDRWRPGAGLYFVILLDGYCLGKHFESGLLLLRDTLRITLTHGLLGADPADSFLVTLADGTRSINRPEPRGKILLKGIAPGLFTITPVIKGVPLNDLSAMGTTGAPNTVVFPRKFPVFDAHLQIKESCCCPLPLQRFFFPSLAGSPHVIEECEPKHLALPGSVRLDGGVSAHTSIRHRIHSCQARRSFMHHLKNFDAHIEHSWIHRRMLDKGISGKRSNEKNVWVAGGADISVPVGTRRGSLSGRHFHRSVRLFDRHFDGTRPEHITLPPCTDFTFAHRWGMDGLPYYLYSGGEMLYISESYPVHSGGDPDEPHVKCMAAAQPATAGEGTPCMSLLIDEIDSFADEIGTTGIEILPMKNFKTASTGHCNYATSNTAPVFFSEDNPPSGLRRLVPAAVKPSGKGFVHVLSRVPEKDLVRFEDYALQRDLTRATIACFPLSCFGGYQYDPRRHILGNGIDVKDIAKRILSNHLFLGFPEDDPVKSAAGNGTPGFARFTVHPMLNSLAGLTEILEPHLRSNRDALDELFLYGDPEGKGIFWFVSMNPEQGWYPDDFENYPNLGEFFDLCGDTVPIMVNCSPPFPAVSANRDEGRRRACNRSHGKEGYNLSGTDNRSQPAVSPVHWKTVLKRNPGLKICFVQCMESGVWNAAGGFRKAEYRLRRRTARSARCRCTESDFYRDWIGSIAELAQTCEHVYFDLRLPAQPEQFTRQNEESAGNRDEDRELARNLCFLLSRYPDLKDRMLLGMQWSHTVDESEMGFTGNLARLFGILAKVSLKTGYDAWHRFTVINPSRFMGIIGDCKGNAERFEIRTELLEKYARRLSAFLTDDCRSRYGISLSRFEIEDLMRKKLAGLTLLPSTPRGKTKKRPPQEVFSLSGWDSGPSSVHPKTERRI